MQHRKRTVPAGKQKQKVGVRDNKDTHYMGNDQQQVKDGKDLHKGYNEKNPVQQDSFTPDSKEQAPSPGRKNNIKKHGINKKPNP